MDFVLTSDLDWASEFAIETFLAIAGEFSIKPTLFVTHRSEAVERAAAEGRAERGIHPNLSPGSSHGDTADAIVEHVLRLAPEASAWRCHRYADGESIRAAVEARGLRVDSNLCLHMQPAIVPQYHQSGAVRLPVFFEDDIHWSESRSWNFADHAAAFGTAGMKILNFHPFFIALNIPDAEFYARHKPHIRTLTGRQAAALRHPGKGAGTFLVDALSSIRAAGHRFVTLSALAENSPPRTVDSRVLVGQ